MTRFGRECFDEWAQRSDPRRREPVHVRRVDVSALAQHFIENRQPDGGPRLVHGVDGLEIEDARHAIAVTDREAAGIDLGLVDQARIDHAENALVAWDVKCLAQWKAVKQCQQLAGFPAANARLRGNAILRKAGQAPECANRVLRRLPAGRERVAVDIHGPESSKAVERVTARRHDHFAQLRAGRRQSKRN